MSTDDTMKNVKPELFWPPNASSIYYVKVEPDMGILMGVPVGDDTYESHIALLPEAKGYAEIICKKAIKWLFANEDCSKIIANIPEYNRLAIRLANVVGMKFIEKKLDAFRKNNTSYNILSFEIRR